jgi:hypothetical protein
MMRTPGEPFWIVHELTSILLKHRSILDIPSHPEPFHHTSNSWGLVNDPGECPAQTGAVYLRPGLGSPRGVLPPDMPDPGAPVSAQLQVKLGRSRIEGCLGQLPVSVPLGIRSRPYRRHQSSRSMTRQGQYRCRGERHVRLFRDRGCRGHDTCSDRVRWTGALDGCVGWVRWMGALDGCVGREVLAVDGHIRESFFPARPSPHLLNPPSQCGLFSSRKTLSIAKRLQRVVFATLSKD